MQKRKKIEKIEKTKQANKKYASLQFPNKQNSQPKTYQWNE